jgi:hypothetical protein
LFDPPLTSGMAIIPHVTQEKEDDSGIRQANDLSNDPYITHQSNRNVLIKLGSLPSVHEINTWSLIFGEAATSMHLFFVIKKPTKQQHGFLSNAPPKRYPDVYAAPYLSSIRYDTGIDAGMVRHELSGRVRHYFPGILEDTLHPFLHCMGCVNPKIELAKHRYPFENLKVFPFEACCRLYNNPPVNKNDTNKIHQLADAVLPPPAKGSEQ